MKSPNLQIFIKHVAAIKAGLSTIKHTYMHTFKKVKETNSTMSHLAVLEISQRVHNK